jgi:hypothetical protein
MDTFVDTFKDSYTLIPFLVLFSLFILFLDSKIQDYETERRDYIKTAIIVAFVSWVAIYINTGSFTVNKDDILIGAPPF